MAAPSRVLLALVVPVLLAAACDAGTPDAPAEGTDATTVEGATPADRDAAGEQVTGEAVDGEPGDGEGADERPDGAELAVACEVDLAPDGPGSLSGMSEDPAATAIANNPELSTLAEAIQQAGLDATLDDPGADRTVFAPDNAAFDELPDGELEALLADPDALEALLTHHVVGDQELGLGELVDQGAVAVLGGGEVAVHAPDERTVLVGDEEARVICADVATTTATLHIIDSVLRP